MSIVIKSANENEAYFEDAVVQTMELLNFSVVPRKPIENPSETIHPTSDSEYHEENSVLQTENESNPIHELFSKLQENDLKVLQEQLEAERNLRAVVERKFEKLMEYVSLLHSEFSKFLDAFMEMTKPDRSAKYIVSIGPFQDKFSRNEFFSKFKYFVCHFSGLKVDEFFETIETLQSLNSLLEHGKISHTANPKNQDENRRKEKLTETECTANFAKSVDINNETDNNTDLATTSSATNCLPEINLRPSILQQLLVSSPSPPISNRKTTHCVDNSKRDFNYFYCSCGAKFPKDNYLSLSTHIKELSESRVEQEKDKDDSSSNVVLKCFHCGQLFFTRSDYTHHYQIKHGNPYEKEVEAFGSDLLQS